MDYNKLNEATKTFLKQAAHIYAVINGEDIKNNPNHLLNKFSDYDKKILSLFMAGMAG